MGDHESVGECPPVNDQTAKDGNNMNRKVCDALVQFNDRVYMYIPSKPCIPGNRGGLTKIFLSSGTYIDPSSHLMCTQLYTCNIG